MRTAWAPFGAVRLRSEKAEYSPFWTEEMNTVEHERAISMSEEEGVRARFEWVAAFGRRA